MKCPQCEGTGKMEKPIAMGVMGEVECDMCEGTGALPDNDNNEVVNRLDRIIDLLLEWMAK